MNPKHICLLFCAFCFFTAASHADSTYPMLLSLHPVAVQAGAKTECEVRARYSLAGAYRVLVTGDGVSAEIDPLPQKPIAAKRQSIDRTKIRFLASPDALLGPREVRLATPQGVSTVGMIVVTRDPIVHESSNNDTLKTAQSIPLPATVCGAIEKAEDVDYYRFTVAGGAALTFHVQSQRLQNRIHDLQEHSDPIITLKNSAGTVLAANDNYYFGDPLLHYRFAMAGDYFLEIRDARYGGNPNWTYCIEISDRPFVTNAFPPRLTPGIATKLRLIGYNLPADPSIVHMLPRNASDGIEPTILLLTGKQTTNTVPVVVSRLPETVEAPADKDTVAHAQKVAAPTGISGCIAKENEIDCYRFGAAAGERFSFEVVARELQSALDSNLRLLSDKGQRLAENDDFTDRYVHADSRIMNWAAPAKGDYVVEVRDLHLRGGPNFVYFLKITRAKPHFVLDVDTDKTLLAPGTTGVVFARAVRRNGFEGAVQLHVEGLPPGVSARCGIIPGHGQDGSILLQAEAGAKQGAANIRIWGTAKDAEDGASIERTAVGRPLQEIYMPGGGRNHYPVATHAVSVGAPLDLRSVKISPATLTLKPGETKKIEISIDRAPGFKSNVTLDAAYQHLGTVYGNSLPPGVTVVDKASNTLLTGDKSRGFITLKAAADAKPIENHQAVIMAHVSINFVMKFTYSSEPLLITVAK